MSLNIVSIENISHEVPTTLKTQSPFLSSASSTALKLPLKSTIIEKILEFHRHHQTNPPTIPKPLPGTLQEHIPAWDFAFIELDIDTLVDLTQASQMLKIQPLLDLCCAKIASLIRENTCEGITKIFNIQEDN